MKILLVFALTLALAAGYAQRPTNVPLQDLEAIQTIIRAQIEAFRKDDGATAYSFASPSIRQVFPDSKVFMEMVKSGYPQIYRSLTVEFAQATRNSADEVLQIVNLIGRDGSRAVAAYLMQRQPGGVWKINGVQMNVEPRPGNA
ncbi:MAG: DUF4864 domain-containing protein [Meiothermus sp.]|nr:DUF4864 domain-containing protein [Meiothermus sp.]